MTEQEWLTAIDPASMLNFLRGKASERKLRLLACACCRRYQSVLRGKKNLRVLQFSEEFADGRISRKEMQHEREKWYTFDSPFPLPRTWQSALSFATMPSMSAWNVAINTMTETAQARSQPKSEHLAQATLVREIMGNPFRPITVDAAWVTSSALALATSIYEERAFDRLPILADALEDAGCSDADLLSHCRSEGPHVRGCWVVDLLLGKS